MRIIIATPLYPPDIAEPAPYSKEAARRLAQKHDVTVVAYGRLPEKAPRVKAVLVSKQQPLLVRLLRYTFALMSEARCADIVYAQNGASVELPAGIAALFLRKPLIMHIADVAANERAKKTLFPGLIQQFAFRQAREVLADRPLSKPEILPFEPAPTDALAAYEASWIEHLATLEALLHHA